MTKKQIHMAYQNLSDAEKVERLEFWAQTYLDYLGVPGKNITAKEALMSDCIDYYKLAKGESEDE